MTNIGIATSFAKEYQTDVLPRKFSAHIQLACFIAFDTALRRLSFYGYTERLQS